MKNPQKMYPNINKEDINKECLALLRAILLSSNCRYRDTDWVNIFIPFTTPSGKKELHISLSLDKYWIILKYLDMEVTK